ncbi:hypothetical protein OEZ17_11065 [Enterococcus avium]|uniref:hypothetical protein n=1 Tax=Enterococcus avium TaxID=33945 RepID=UPI0025B24957|nr:hypothetical protein [Enterococcus avium]MDN2638046.1 hypothetical protein [Enterococcus avium]
MFIEDYNKENWKSLVEEVHAVENDFINVNNDNLFGFQSKLFLEELIGDSGPNVFGGPGLIENCCIEDTVNALGESIKLLVLKNRIDLIMPNFSWSYVVDYPIGINADSESPFLDLLSKIKKSQPSMQLLEIINKLVEEEYVFDQIQYNIAQGEELNELLHSFCKEIIGRRIHVDGRIAYDCRDHKQEFFVESISFD